MEILISNASEKPIYEQITGQIKAMILSGKLPEGAALPSLRLLAKELRISVITTKRAYADLERDGFVETVAGKGCFVARRNHALVREEQLRQTEQHLQRAVDAAKGRRHFPAGGGGHAGAIIRRGRIMDAIYVQGLTKQYPGFTLGPISFSLPEGSILGFVGENGAGKTTAIKSMLGLVRPQGGTVRMLGQETDGKNPQAELAPAPANRGGAVRKRAFRKTFPPWMWSASFGSCTLPGTAAITISCFPGSPCRNTSP